MPATREPDVWMSVCRLAALAAKHSDILKEIASQQPELGEFIDDHWPTVAVVVSMAREEFTAFQLADCLINERPPPKEEQEGVVDWEMLVERVWDVLRVRKTMTKLRAALSRIVIRERVGSASELSADAWGSAPKPTHFRVNNMHREDVLSSLNTQGFKDATRDPMFPDVIASNDTLLTHQLVRKHHLVPQDRFTSMIAHAIHASPDDVVMFACAGHGTVAAHLSSLVGCSLILVEDDQRRLAEGIRRLQTLSVTPANAINSSFLSLNPKTYKNVTTVVIEAPSSGSGITTRGQFLAQEGIVKVDDDTMAQRGLIKHAMQFPSVQKVLYAVRSTNDAECGYVMDGVKAAAETANFVPTGPLPEWTRRGDADIDPNGNYVRTDPREDGTHGGFIGVLRRRSDDELASSMGNVKRALIGVSRKRRKKDVADEEQAEQPARRRVRKTGKAKKVRNVKKKTPWRL